MARTSTSQFMNVNAKAPTEAETREERCCLLACFPRLSQLAFLAQDDLPRKTHHISQEKGLQTRPHANLVVAVPQGTILSPRLL